VVGTGNAEDIIPRYKNYGFDIVCHQVDLNTGLDMLEDLLVERNMKVEAKENSAKEERTS
jgi:methylaspartate mutase sigma subunit